MAELRFFDCNTFIGRSRTPAPLSFESKEELLASLEYYGVQEAVVTHREACEYAPAVGNHAISRELAGEQALLPCWVLPADQDPVGPSAEELVDQMVRAGVRIARMFPPHRFPYLDAEWSRSGIFAALQTHQIPLLITASDLGKYPDEASQGFAPEQIYALGQAYPRLPLIIVRFNYQNLRVISPLLRECPNLYLEISYYTSHNGVEFITKQFGAERLIFGTGMPVNNPGLALTLVHYARISDAEKRLIAGDNLRRLLADVS